MNVINANEIASIIRARMEELAPLVAECERLEKAEVALAKAEVTAAKRTLNGSEVVAPYGYKADGTPRKRPVPHKAIAARRRIGAGSG